MDSAELQNTLKRLCKVMWEANVTNPITYVTQISYLLFLKMLEEMDVEQKENQNSNYKSLFGRFKVGKREFDFEPLRWSVLTSDPDNERMLRTLRDTLPLFAEHPLLSQGAKAIFENASIVIPNGAALRRAVDVIAPISFMAEERMSKETSSRYSPATSAARRRLPSFARRAISYGSSPRWLTLR